MPFISPTWNDLSAPVETIKTGVSTPSSSVCCFSFLPFD